MGEILDFDIGCRHCENLVKLGKGTYMCADRVHMDDSSVIVMENGKPTFDWHVCGGDSYKRVSNKYAKMS